ncbi:MAG: respiratory chain complex I subunit 1 family protein [Vulcanimicrobiaceae bacterium]
MHTVQILALVAASPLLQGVLRRLRAHLQSKPGPSIWQPYRDLRKLWSKEGVVAHDSTIVLLAPGAVLGVAVTFAAIVPSLDPTGTPPWPFDAVALALLLALGRFVLVLAALDTRSAFEGMAAGREITFAALTEAPLILALLGSAALGDGSLARSTGAMGSITGALAAGALLLVMLSETARIPVDNQETHYELTMIHEGLVLEYSGWQLAMLQYAAYLRQAAFFVLAAILLPATGTLAFLWIIALIALIPLIETAYAKLRLFEVPQLFTSALVLSVASIGLRIAGVIK